jgi:hypothetical protein
MSMTGLEHTVLRLHEVDPAQLIAVLARYGLSIEWVASGTEIPGSFWGDEEAGLIGHTLYLRPDTPLHSALHEGCHWICMTPKRRAALHTDAKGTQAEEDATCYLQVLLADELACLGRARMFRDMDAWGYNFRLGSAGKWFAEDAEDARDWLVARGLLSPSGSLLTDPS